MLVVTTIIDCKECKDIGGLDKILNTGMICPGR